MSTVNLGYESKLWEMADKLRNQIEPSEYKHVVLGLIFLKYITDSFKERYEEVKNEYPGTEEDRDAYSSANVFFVPKEARWGYIQDNAKQPTIGNIIDSAMELIEKENTPLKGVLPKNYGRPDLDKTMLGELIDLFSFDVGGKEARSKDVLGRVYDPCCGSGGMFVRSAKFVEEHQGMLGDISVYGQESIPTTWRLAKMNLAIRGILTAHFCPFLT